jgi:hypothetical protein
MSVSFDTSGEILPTVVYSGGDTSLAYDVSGQLSTNDISLNRTTGRIFWQKGIAVGSYPITIKGITDNSLFDSDIFTLTVNPVKATFHYADATIDYDVSYIATPIIDYNGGDSTIVYDLSENLPEPSYMSFSNGIVSVVAGIPIGSYTVSIKGRNQSNEYHYTQFTITVEAALPSALTYTANTSTISYGVSSEVLISSIYNGGDSQLAYDISGTTPGNVQVNSSTGKLQISGLSAGTYQIPVRATNRKGRTTTFHTIVVQKAVPTIDTSMTSTTITYGQRLSSADLSGRHINLHNNVSVGGSYSFRNSNLLLNAGSHTTTWDFTPSDSNNYEDISGSVSVTVNKKSPDVSNAVNATTIEYGQSIDDATLSGAFYNSYNDATVNGSFAFDLSSSRPSAGNHSYNWTFRPVAGANYNEVTGPVSITVNKSTPDISGSVSLLNNITYGQLLSSSSISGSFKNRHDNTTVPGTIIFDLSSSVPSAGTSTYSWTFIPNNRNNYNDASGSISVAVAYASNSSNIKNIIDDVSSNVIDISVNETIFDISSFVTNSFFTNPASRVMNSKIYKSRFMYSYVPTQLSQGAIITTNTYNDNPYTLEMTDISDVYNVIVTAVPTPYVISPVTNLTTEFAFTYRVVDVQSGQFVSNLNKTVNAIIDLSGSYNSNRTYKIYHVDTSTGVYTELTKNISNNKVNFQITKNNMIIGGSQVNTPPPSTTAYATITLPFIFDISASNVIVYGEDLSSGLINADYSVGDTTGSLSASSMRDALVYRDSSYNDWSNNDVIVADASGVALAINKLVDTTILDIGPQGSATYANSKYPYSPSPLSSHFIQYIASVLFGHPQAQAPIKNDLSVMDELYNCNMGAQFTGPSGLGDPVVRRSIFEQLVGSVPERFGIQDTDGPYKPLPFQTGDTIFFRVKMAGNLLTDNTAHIQGATPVDLTKLFAQQIQNGYIDGATLKMNPKVWKIKLVLG